MREPYPSAATARDRFVIGRRGGREVRDAWRHQEVIVEDERAVDGGIARVATVFLTGRECPWRCVMCDLWRYTIEEDTPVGAIPAQIEDARRLVEAAGESGRPVRVMKLYNAGSFFDPRAVPESDYGAIAQRLAGLERVIVEAHPALIGARVDRFVEALGRAEVVRSRRSRAGRSEVATSEVTRSEVMPPRLEVAMGLETTHPEALERLHKRITLARFAEAAEELRRRDVALRVFLLISPPFIAPDEQDPWLLRSIDFAFECGATAVSLVPTRPGNGAMEALEAEGLFRQPTLDDIERSFEAALAHVRLTHAARARGGRVFVDLWDLRRFADFADRADPADPDVVDAPSEFAARRERLRVMNLEQRVS